MIALGVGVRPAGKIRKPWTHLHWSRVAEHLRQISCVVTFWRQVKSFELFCRYGKWGIGPAEITRAAIVLHVCMLDIFRGYGVMFVHLESEKDDQRIQEEINRVSWAKNNFAPWGKEQRTVDL